MAAETLKDFLVGIGFDVDEQGSEKADSVIENLESLVKQLAKVLTAATDNVKGLIDGAVKSTEAIDGNAQSIQNETAAMQENASAARESSEAHKEGGEAVKKHGDEHEKTGKKAEKAAKDLKKANNEAKMKGAKEGSANVQKLDNQLKKTTGTVKKFISAALAAVVGTGIKTAISDTIKFTESLVSSARQMKKTVEETRAYNTALKVMGKTAQEIEADESLKTLFADLQSLGTQMALPEAAQGVSTIHSLMDAFTQLKFVAQYAMQWIMYKIQTVASGPLTEVRDMVSGIREWFMKHVDSITTAIAQYAGWIVQLFSSSVKFIAQVIQWIDKLPPSIKMVGAAVLAVIASVRSRFILIGLLIAAASMLIDDFMTYLEGGDALFADFWQWAVNAFEKVKGAIEDAKTSVINFYESSKDENGKVNWIAFGLKIGGWIIKGAKALLGQLGDLIKKWVTGSEESSWPEVGQRIYNGIEEKLSNMGATVRKWITGEENTSWTEVGQAIVNGIKDKSSAILDQLKSSLGLEENATLPEVGAAIVKGILDKATEIFNTLKGALVPADGWESVGDSLWGFISRAMETSAQKQSDFWNRIIKDGIDRGGALGFLETTIGRVFLLVTTIRSSIVKAVDKLQENGTLGTIWTTLQTIAGDVLTIVTDIINALTGNGAKSSALDNLGEVLSGDIQRAVQIISGALQAAESVLNVIAGIIGKAAEMGILDEALAAIAATLIAIKTYNAIQPLINLFSAIATGVKILGLANPELALLAATIGVLAATIPAVVDGWNRMMWGIDEAESNSFGLDDLRFKLSDLSRDMELYGAQTAKEFADSYGESISDYMQQAIAENANFSDDMKQLLMGLNDNDWLEMLENYKQNGVDAIHAYVEGQQQAIDEADITVPGIDDSTAEALANTKAQAETASASVDSLAASLAELETNANGVGNADISFEDAVASANDLLEKGKKAAETVLDTSTTSQEAIEEVKVSSEEAAQGIIDAFVKMGEPIGPVFDSIVLMCKNTVSDIRDQLKSIPQYTEDAFTKAANSVKKSWGGVADWFGQQISKIKSSIDSLPKTISFGTSGLPGHSEGGVITKETVSKLGEGNKKEYVIPVTKPGRGIPLLQSAARDMGLTVQSISNANKMLGGGPTKNVTPSYAVAGSTVNNVTNNNYNNTVNVPSTFNIQGTNDRAIADQVAQNQQRLVIRNLKSAMA